MSNFKYNFREQDPDHKLRVQAIVEKTIGEAQKNVNKKLFAKHLMNSRKDIKDV